MTGSQVAPGRWGSGAEWAALAFAMVFPSFGTWLYFIHFTGSPHINTVYALAKAVQFGFPVAWILLTSQREPRDLLGSAVEAAIRLRWGRALAPGLLTGASMAAVILAVYALLLRDSPSTSAVTSQLAARLREIGAAAPARFVGLALFLSVVHSFLEEYYWRWFVFGRLSARAGLVPALAAGSLAFAAHHVVVLWYYLASGPGAWMIWPFTAGVAAGGAVWGWQYHRHGSLAPPWISHVVADLAIMAAGYDLAVAA